MGTLFYGYDTNELQALSTKGGRMKGDLNIGRHRLYGVAAPTDPSGAASKEYLEQQVPSGLICMWSGTIIPAAWKLCNGSNSTPDLRDRFIISAGALTVGSTGGRSSHTLRLSEMLPHKHDMPGYCNTIGTGTKSEDDGFKGKDAEINVGKSEGDELKLQTEDAGGRSPASGVPPIAAPFDIVPPYYTLAFIMKA